MLIDYFFEEGRNDDAKKLIQENIHLPRIRSILVHELIEEKDFEGAKALVNQGLSLAEKDRLFGLVMEWNKFLLKIAEIQGDISSLRKYLENFAFGSSFNKEYYLQLKASYTKEEWPSIIKSKINSIHENVLKEQKSLKRSLQMPDYVLLYLLGPIFVEEEMLEDLKDLIIKQKDLQIVLQYHPYLYKTYPNDLISLYILLLNEQAELASERSHYKKLLEVVHSIYLDIPSGRSILKEQVLFWRFSYKRRPAMLDEINKFIVKSQNLY